jgi:aspartate carbamoyltransferase catalytic subunit
MRHFTTISDLTRPNIEALLASAKHFKQVHRDAKHEPILHGKLVLTMFFEPSTRTRLSFESAALRSGASVLGFSDAAATSTKKGETLEDTVRMAMSYADCLVLRHPEEGSAARAARVSTVPIINAGDGSNEHPSQTLVDVFTMHEQRGSIDGVRIAFVGDLAHGRTVHSLITALAKFRDVHVTLVSPATLALPDSYLRFATGAGIQVETRASAQELVHDHDFIYMTRIQKERFASGDFVLPDAFKLGARDFNNAASNLRVLHPLPRVDEISKDVDALPHAAYFEQAANGVPMRQAILQHVLLQ